MKGRRWIVIVGAAATSFSRLPRSHKRIGARRRTSCTIWDVDGGGTADVQNGGRPAEAPSSRDAECALRFGWFQLPAGEQLQCTSRKRRARMGTTAQDTSQILC